MLELGRLLFLTPPPVSSSIIRPFLLSLLTRHCADKMANGGRQALQFLEDSGLDTPQVAQYIKEEGVEFIDDLAHCFRPSKHVIAEAPFMLEAWLKAASRKTEAWKRTTDYAQALRELKGSSSAIRNACLPLARGSGARREISTKAVRPKPGGTVDSLNKDTVSRNVAAREAIKLSLSWAPRAGVARGLEKDDPLVEMVEQVNVERIAKFEARGVWLALKEWGAWTSFFQKHARGEGEVEAIVLASAFISGKSEHRASDHVEPPGLGQAPLKMRTAD